MDSKSISAEENWTANPMELSEEIRSTGSRKRKADDGGSPLSPLETSDEFEDDDMGEYDEEQGGDGEESDVSSREEGQEWDVDSFDDGFDYRPKRNLDPNDELGQKMHRYRSQMYRSKVFTFLLQLLIQISSIYTTFDENFGPLIVTKLFFFVFSIRVSMWIEKTTLGLWCTDHSFPLILINHLHTWDVSTQASSQAGWSCRTW